MFILITSVFFFVSVILLSIYLKDVADKEVLQITYTEAIDLLSRANKKFEFPVTRIFLFIYFFICNCHEPTFSKVRRKKIIPKVCSDKFKKKNPPITSPPISSNLTLC